MMQKQATNYAKLLWKISALSTRIGHVGAGTQHRSSIMDPATSPGRPGRARLDGLPYDAITSPRL